MINQNQLRLLHFGKRRDTGGEGITIGDNPAGHCFLLRCLIPVNFYQIIHDFETKNGHHRQNLG